MDLLQAVTSMFGTNQSVAGAQGTPTDNAQGADGLHKLLGPAALGGLAGILFGGKGIGGAIKGALVGGGGAYLWDEYKKRFREDNASDPQFQGGAASAPAERAQRIIRAMIYAAKADGRIDDKEKAGINEKIKALGIGQQAQQIVDAAMIEPLEPARVAEGVMDEEEALQLFTLSVASIKIDNFMEQSYIGGLASALHIPNDVRDQIIQKVQSQMS